PAFRQRPRVRRAAVAWPERAGHAPGGTPRAVFRGRLAGRAAGKAPGAGRAARLGVLRRHGRALHHLRVSRIRLALPCPTPMTQDRHLIEEKTGSEEILKGRFLHAYRDTVRLPDGGTATREYVVHPGAVMAV